VETVKEFIKKKHERNQHIDMFAPPEDVIKALKKGTKKRQNVKHLKLPKRELA
jgi:hypothetical protein